MQDPPLALFGLHKILISLFLLPDDSLSLTALSATMGTAPPYLALSTNLVRTWVLFFLLVILLHALLWAGGHCPAAS